MIGYIDETDQKFVIQLQNNEIKEITRLIFDTRRGTYVYPHSNNDDNIHITQFWPIRFLLLESGATSCTFNQVVFDKNKYLVLNY